MSYKILLIEPDPGCVARFRKPLADAGYDVVVTSDVSAAVEALERERPDMAMVGSPAAAEGSGLCRALKHSSAGANVPVLLITGPDASATGDHDGWIDRSIHEALFLDACQQYLPSGGPDAPVESRSQVAVPVTVTPSLVESDEVDDALDRLESFLFETDDELVGTEIETKIANAPETDPAQVAPNVGVALETDLRREVEKAAGSSDSIDDSLRELARLQEERDAVDRPIGSTTVTDLSEVPLGEPSPFDKRLFSGSTGVEQDIDAHLDDLFSDAGEPELAASVPAGPDAVSAPSKHQAAASHSIAEEVPLPATSGGGAVRSQFTEINDDLAILAGASTATVGEATLPAPAASAAIEVPAIAEDFPVQPEERTRGGRGLWLIAACIGILLAGGVILVLSNRGAPADPLSGGSGSPGSPPAADPAGLPVAALPGDEPGCAPGETCGEGDLSAGIGSADTAPAAAASPDELPVQTEPTPQAQRPEPEAAPTPVIPPRPARQAAPVTSAPARPAPKPAPSSSSSSPREPVATIRQPEPDEVRTIVPDPGPVVERLEPEALPEPLSPDPNPIRDERREEPAPAQTIEATPVQPSDPAGQVGPRPSTPSATEPTAPRPDRDRNSDAHMLIKNSSNSGFKPPVLLSRIEPKLGNTSARHSGQTVVLKVLVNEQGKIVKVVVDRGTPDHPELESAAIYAVLNWHYEPATEDGLSVKAWATARFSF